MNIEMKLFSQSFHLSLIQTDSNGMVLQRGQWIQGRFQEPMETNEEAENDGNEIEQSASLDEDEEEFVVESPALEDLSEKEAPSRQRSQSEGNAVDEEPEEANADSAVGPSVVEVEQ